MEFEGEHLWIGKLGHFFVLLAFTASLLATIAYAIASRQKIETDRTSWLKFARINFSVQVAAVLSVFAAIFFICYHHYFEYLYAYKHTAKELEFKYILACIWEDQAGSFLLWSIWHCIIGIFLIFKSKDWEAPVMTVVSFAQLFLAMMIMGTYIASFKIGTSPFVLTRDELDLSNAPAFIDANTNLLRKDYLELFTDGIGLNVLLRNYWMVIHPPILFLGFAAAIIPFSYAYAGLITKRFGEWVKPALPYALFCALVLGVGIMMGGKWAYESLSFGGYWAWDPVENASLVPWLILIAGLHTMVIYKATGHSLRASYLFAILTFVFILYSTFLTRTGVLGDTSVHAFTDQGNAMTVLIRLFVFVFAIPSLILFIVRYKKIPAEHKEEAINSREFWMFIGSLVIFLSAMFIIAKTSVPVYNKIFGTNIAPPEDVEFSFNKVMVLVAVIIGFLTAITQYYKYKSTENSLMLKKIAVPTLVAAVITTTLVFIYPITYTKQGYGFLGAIYFALFACIYAVIANTAYIFNTLKGNLKVAGASFAHIGFTLMIAGMLISSGNKKIISEQKFKDFAMPTAIDPLTKQQDNPAENVNLIREIPTPMGEYTVTFTGDSTGHEKDRRFYHLSFERKDPATQKTTESFRLDPDVYIMKNNSMSSNPDIRNYLTHDIFTYISYALNPEKNKDTSQYSIHEAAIGDTIFYSKGYMILDGVVKNPEVNKFNITPSEAGGIVMAQLSITTLDSVHYKATPMVVVDANDIHRYDDTVNRNLYVQFTGIGTGDKLKIGVKEPNSMIDFVTVKTYIFPYINIVWIGLILMATGLVMSMIYRAGLAKTTARLLLFGITAFLIYMFLFAN